MRVPLSILVLLCSPALAFAGEREGKEEEVIPHADEAVKVATERFEKDFAQKDMDRRLRILRWYGQYMHKDVLKRLKKIWLKDKNVELQAAAATGLGNQLHDKKAATSALMQGIARYEDYATRPNTDTEEDELAQALEARALTNALEALGKLGRTPDKKGWKLLKGLIDHHHDDVAIAMLQWCGTTKEWRALPVILEWFNFYPDGYSWSGGSVKVDTGAAGSKDAKAAKAKFHSKYGGRARKARPKAHAAMKQALVDITGQTFEKPEDLKAWMKENKALLRKHGV